MVTLYSPPPKRLGQFWRPKPTDDMQFVKHEPAFFQADLDYAYQHGGEITLAFLDALPAVLGYDVPNAFLDSRVHMLMDGWWPCIPGWHHDDVDRGPDGKEQPRYDGTARYRPEFYMGIVGSADCLTDFAEGDIELPDVADDEIVYQKWHWPVDTAVNHPAGSLDRVNITRNDVWSFTDRSFHQGVQCKGSGWRWFGRVTVGNPFVKPANEIRRNANVYMHDPMKGW